MRFEIRFDRFPGFLVVGGLALFAGSAASGLPLTEWGTTTRTSTAECPSFCTNFDFGPATGGYNQASAPTSSIADAKGSAAAEASLDPGAGLALPVLRAEASSQSASLGSAFGTAFAVEGYTYDGSGSGDFTLDITLTGTVSDATPADGDTSIEATVYLFREENFAFVQDIPTLIFEYGAVEIDSQVLSIAGNETDAVRSGSLSFSLAPGESVYLWTQLRAEAERDLSFADAFSTLTHGFRDATGLSSASNVPEPATAVLLGTAVAGLAAARRRRR